MYSSNKQPQLVSAEIYPLKHFIGLTQKIKGPVAPFMLLTNKIRDHKAGSK
jgi:hypothetical protein